MYLIKAHVPSNIDYHIPDLSKATLLEIRYILDNIRLQGGLASTIEKWASTYNELLRFGWATPAQPSKSWGASTWGTFPRWKGWQHQSLIMILSRPRCPQTLFIISLICLRQHYLKSGTSWIIFVCKWACVNHRDVSIVLHKVLLRPRCPIHFSWIYLPTSVDKEIQVCL